MAAGRHVRRRPSPTRISARDLRASRAWEAIAGCYPRTGCATRRNHARWPHMVAGQRPLASRTGLRNGRERRTAVRLEWRGDARHRVRPCAARDLLAAAAAVRPPSGDDLLADIRYRAGFGQF
ncbi:hypothetical protein F511_27767 [Dorcoceras hygrometricum]|uniref:Uncharacterized protein n=1 Tax=Dorcoceras hygrometricum TaxID=472368 RepID=A0A2Z7AHT5_9LAMI|nr:hypothetical protein F511_27767 [Dorcoceras hygrometricum]